MTKTQKLNQPKSTPTNRIIELTRKGALAVVQADQCGNEVRITISGQTAHAFQGFFPGDIDSLFEEFVTKMTNDMWAGEER